MEKVTRISLTEKFRSLESICDEFDRARENMLGRATTIHMRICLGKRGRKTDRVALQEQRQELSEFQIERPLGWSIPRMGKSGCSGALIVEFNAIGKRQELRLQTRKNC